MKKNMALMTMLMMMVIMSQWMIKKQLSEFFQDPKNILDMLRMGVSKIVQAYAFGTGLPEHVL